jgi:hypothetical protein
MFNTAQTLLKNMVEFEWCELCHNLAVQEPKSEKVPQVK